MALLIALCIAVRSTDPERQDLFVPSTRYPCFRQPILLTSDVQRSHLLAFAENRNVTNCAPQALAVAGPEEVGSLLLRRSLDSGKTWLPMQTLYYRPGLNIDFLAGVTDTQRGRVWLMLQEQLTVKVFTSDDEGVSWSVARDLFTTWNISSWSLDIKPSSLKPGCGHGIQVESALCANNACKEAGRLIIPFVCTNHSASGQPSDKGCATCLACNLYSDDGGESWLLGGVGQAGTRESQASQVWSATSSAELYINERNMGGQPGHRMYARSTDGGSTYNPASFGVDQTLTSPVTPSWTGIVAGVSRLTAPQSGKQGSLVYSGPAALTERANMTLHLSTDEGVTWSSGKSFWSGFAGYSDLAWVGSSSVAMIFENGDLTFSDRVSVAVFPSTWFGQTAV